jgi:hypothetical protein
MSVVRIPITGGDTWMAEGTLPPECRLDLHIHLDRLRSAEERCREGLRSLTDGTLTREQYLEVLRQQLAAQSDWLRKHREYFRSIDV